MTFDGAQLRFLPNEPAPKPRQTVIGYAPGVFDLFHVGHLNVLRRSKLQCDRLVAGVVSDEAATLQKGRRPVVPQEERLEIVRSMRFVDDALIEWTVDKMAIWKAVRFDLIFKGDDWRGSQKYTELEEELATVGASVVYLPYTGHTSTTHLRSVTGRS